MTEFGLNMQLANTTAMASLLKKTIAERGTKVVEKGWGYSKADPTEISADPCHQISVFFH